jgi:hypothetical protein
MGDTYTADTKASYQEWQSLNALRPAAAKAYYGEQLHTSFQKFDSLTRGGLQPNAAYIRSFGDPTIYGTADVPRERQKEVNAAVTSHIEGLSSSWYNPFSWGSYELNTSAKSVVASAIKRQVGVAAKNSDQPTSALVADAIDYARKNNSLETYATFAWVNKPGTKPLHTVLKLQPADAAEVFSGAVGYYLKKAGYADGAQGQLYDIIRSKGPNDTTLFYITAKNEEDPSENRSVVITQAQLEATAQNLVKGKRTAAAPRKPTQVRGFGLSGPK